MGALTIESPFGKVTWLKGRKPDGYEMLTRRNVDGHPVWTIPEGMHAHIRVMG